MKLEIRQIKISDAQRFYEIINDDRFEFFTSVKSVKDEEDYLKIAKSNSEKNLEHNYAIEVNGKIIGGCGIKIDQHRKWIAELGYFIDANEWGKGYATAATKELEQIAINKHKIKRLEIIANVKNIASQKVALKCGYEQECIRKKAMEEKGFLVDCYAYSKVFD